MNDDFCVCGNKWIKVFNTVLCFNCYYCPSCDKVYKPTVIEVPREELSEMFAGDRFDKIKEFALISEARKKVTPYDLERMGYL